MSNDHRNFSLLLLPVRFVCSSGCTGLEVCGPGVGQDLPVDFPVCLSSRHHPHLHSSSADVHEDPSSSSK